MSRKRHTPRGSRAGKPPQPKHARPGRPAAPTPTPRPHRPELPADAAPLPEELATFWTAFTTQQFERGNRDVGRMVQTALEQFFNRGSERLAPLLQQREDLEAFGIILAKEVGRADRALAGQPEGKLAKAFRGSQYVLGARKSPRRAAAEATQIKPLPRPLVALAELRAYREALQVQAVAAERATAENMRVLMESRDGLQRSLTALAPALYSTAIALLDARDAAGPPPPRPTIESWPEAPPRATMTALLPDRPRGLFAAIGAFFARLAAAFRAWGRVMSGRQGPDDLPR